MKKFLILGFFAAVIGIGITSCSEDEATCYTCTNAAFAGCELDICESEITTNNACGGGSFTANKNGL